MPWLQQVGHWLHTTFLSLRGLSVVSIALMAVAAVVVLRLASGLVRVVVPVVLVAGGGYLLLHLLHVV